MVVAALNGTAWFVVFLASHLALTGLASSKHRGAWTKIVFVSCIVLICACAAPLLAAAQSPPVSLAIWLIACLWGVLVFLCFFVLYMPFFFVLATSLSLETIILLSHAPGGRLNVTALEARFASEAFAKRRLDLMVGSGMLEQALGRYLATPKGRIVALAFNRLKTLWRLQPGG